MTTDPKRKTLQDDSGRDKRRQQEAALDDALKNTFPASDLLRRRSKRAIAGQRAR